VTIWDWERGEIVQTMPGWAQDVDFDPSGTWVATGSIFGLGEIWEARSGERIATLSGHTGAISSVEFSPDGSLVATTGTDGTIRVWDPESGTQRQVLQAHDKDVWALAFSPDGSRLASSSPEGIVRIWALDLDDLIEIARRELTRDLTGAECRQYLHLEACPT
jgi:WD40 repeat protein